MVTRSLGFPMSARQMRVSTLDAGIGRLYGKPASEANSSRINCITLPAVPPSSYSTGSSVARRISSRNSGVIAKASQRCGIVPAASGAT